MCWIAALQENRAAHMICVMLVSAMDPGDNIITQHDTHQRGNHEPEEAIVKNRPFVFESTSYPSPH